jgi:aspartyl-tRNA(Asn)/glutamyl-tRNA(Gln) amidotransferase subunit C
MDEIINMVEQLGEVDTTDVPVTSTVTEEVNVMREDVAVKGTDRTLLMKNVPEEKDGLIKVPAIIDESEEG